MSREQVLIALYGQWVAPYAALVAGDVRGTAVVGVYWHEQSTSPIEIDWTETYDGRLDEFTFKGELTGYDPATVNGQKVYLGKGTVSGARAAWAACNPGIESTPSGTVSATFVAGLNGDGTITISAFADVMTPLAGVSTAPFTVSLDGGFGEFSTGLAGELCPHSKRGKLTYLGGSLPNVPVTP